MSQCRSPVVDLKIEISQKELHLPIVRLKADGFPESVEAYLKNAALNGMPPEKADTLRKTFRKAGWNGFLRSQLESLEKGSKANSVDPYGRADLYARLGQKDEAFAWFNKAFEVRRLSAV